MIKLLLQLLTSTLLLSSFSALATTEPGIVFYSDNDNDRVYKIDIPSMTLLASVDTADQPYPVDLAGPNKIFAITRNDPSVGIINICTFEEETRLALNHKPRSSSYNPQNHSSLISGKDKPQTTLVKVKNAQIKLLVGSEIYNPPVDFGGSNATGHPFWVSKHRFLQLDRTTRNLQYYSVKGDLLDTLVLPSAMHHILQAGSDYYAVLEGGPQQGIYPGLVRFAINGNHLVQTGEVSLTGFDPAIMGSHHADFHPDGIHIYMGSTEGHLFVIDRNAMTVVAVAEVGLGAGHTVFAPDRSIAIITNHNDTFVSVIDTNTHTNIQNITVANAPPSGRKSQGHTASVSPDENFYYGIASQDGTFYEIDLNQMAITRSLYLGGYTLQGSFLWGEQPGKIGHDICL
jgi:DNA-binding beta-propeller fold protein YncE